MPVSSNVRLLENTHFSICYASSSTIANSNRDDKIENTSDAPGFIGCKTRLHKKLNLPAIDKALNLCWNRWLVGAQLDDALCRKPL